MSILMLVCATILASASKLVSERLRSESISTENWLSALPLSNVDRAQIAVAVAALEQKAGVRLAIGVADEDSAHIPHLGPREARLALDMPNSIRAKLLASADVEAAVGMACVREAVPTWFSAPEARMSLPGRIQAITELVGHRVADDWLADPLGRARNTYPPLALICGALGLFGWLFGKRSPGIHRDDETPFDPPPLEIMPSDIPLPELRAMVRDRAESLALRKLEENQRTAVARLTEVSGKLDAARMTVGAAKVNVEAVGQVNILVRPLLRRWRQGRLRNANKNLARYAAAAAEAQVAAKKAGSALGEMLAELAARYMDKAHQRFEAQVRSRRTWRQAIQAFSTITIVGFVVATIGAVSVSAVAALDIRDVPVTVPTIFLSTYQPPPSSKLAMAAASSGVVGERLRYACAISAPVGPEVAIAPFESVSRPVLSLSVTPSCEVGKPCGKACVAQDSECHVDDYPGWFDRADCRVGKSCGDACIAQDKECHIGEFAGNPLRCDVGKRCGGACIPMAC